MKIKNLSFAISVACFIGLLSLTSIAKADPNPVYTPVYTIEPSETVITPDPRRKQASEQVGGSSKRGATGAITVLPAVMLPDDDDSDDRSPPSP